IKQGRRLTYKAGGHGWIILLLGVYICKFRRRGLRAAPEQLYDIAGARAYPEGDLRHARRVSRDLLRIEEQVSSTLTHEAARDLRAWTDNRSKFLAKKAKRLERNNSFREHRAAAIRARSEDAANAKKSARRIQAWLRGPRPSRPYDDSGYRQDVKRWAKRGTEAHDRRRHYLA
ncbi:hypothetical protein FOZ63_018714, partial [Perkinsus olseni]